MFFLYRSLASRTNWKKAPVPSWPVYSRRTPFSVTPSTKPPARLRASKWSTDTHLASVCLHSLKGLLSTVCKSLSCQSWRLTHTLSACVSLSAFCFLGSLHPQTKCGAGQAASRMHKVNQGTWREDRKSACGWAHQERTGGQSLCYWEAALPVAGWPFLREHITSPNNNRHRDVSTDSYLLFTDISL